LFTLSGAALGAAAAWLKGENMARARVQNLTLGGVQVSVGPNQYPQFPFVLIDRLLLYYQSVINWAHARRDQPASFESAHEMKSGYTARWSNERRKLCLKFFKTLEKKKPEARDDAQRECERMLTEALQEVGSS
jgi:hypothetical protein